ncbi:RNA recognition motif-containing protein [uncultured Prochlorococcus sp.]|uniref:RNA recognition motif-containing protein n=1 Tax=uncultured Prochlorococcus sp. TaxID=159733 RepID=UPI00258A6882|nr:RNA recognition motif-containing protein [uncultured Prochlorococcus sp.]
MTLSLNIGELFNDSSSHALVDELRKRTSVDEILEFEEKFNSKNEKNLHTYICRFLKNRSISRGLASKWLLTIIKNKESKIDALLKENN